MRRIRDAIDAEHDRLAVDDKGRRSAATFSLEREGPGGQDTRAKVHRSQGTKIGINDAADLQSFLSRRAANVRRGWAPGCLIPLAVAAVFGAATTHFCKPRRELN
jgi:hypothetical protein